MTMAKKMEDWYHLISWTCCVSLNRHRREFWKHQENHIPMAPIRW